MLRVDHISFAYNGRSILADLSLECQRGEIVGIVGASGSGKTTALNLFSGYLRSQSGSVTVDGVSPRQAAQAQKIGYVFQTAALLPWATVAANVAMPLRLKSFRRTDIALGRVGSNADKERVRWALELAQIGHAANQYPHELSGGMKTRVALARAVVYEPRLLLLDEATTGLDDIVKENLYPVLQEVIAATEAATVLVGHDLREVLLLCDRVYVLRPDDDRTSHLVHCENVPFKRPRGVELFDDSYFIAARRRLREKLS